MRICGSRKKFKFGKWLGLSRSMATPDLLWRIDGRCTYDENVSAFLCEGGFWVGSGLRRCVPGRGGTVKATLEPRRQPQGERSRSTRRGRQHGECYQTSHPCKPHSSPLLVCVHRPRLSATRSRVRPPVQSQSGFNSRKFIFSYFNHTAIYKIYNFNKICF